MITTRSIRPRPARTGRLAQLAVLVPTLAVVATAGIGSAAGGHASPQHRPGSAPSARVCFPASSWSPAPDAIRPCVRVTRLYEDGSFHFQVSDANGTVRYGGGVGVPNGYEYGRGGVR